MREWKEYSLTEFAEFNPKIGVQPDQEYSFVEMPDLEPGRKHVYPSGKRKPNGLTKFQNGDTLFAKITPCLENGKISQVQGLEGNIGVGSTEFFVFRGRENLSDNDFVHYLLRWYSVKKYAEKNMSGSAGHQRVPADCLHNLKLPLPTYDENKKIGVLLSCLDNKIENLLRQNQTLEKIAQTLFKQWFVDFNFPDKNGNPYKDSGGEMVASELDEIPNGWRVGRLQELTKIINGRAYKNTEFKLEGTPIVRIQNLTGKGQTVYSDLELHENKYISAGDLIYAWSATFGPYIWRGPRSIYHYHIWRLDCDKHFKYFLYLYLKRISDNVRNQGTGSIFTHITKTLMENQEAVVPDDKTIILWDKIAEKIFEKLMANHYQIQTLTQTRDTLLPKLMSGQIRIKD